MTYDPEVDASYVRLSDASVAATDAISDLLAVDLDAAGSPVGVEVLKSPGAVTPDDETAVTRRYPGLGDAFEALRRIAQPA